MYSLSLYESFDKSMSHTVLCFSNYKDGIFSYSTSLQNNIWKNIHSKLMINSNVVSFDPYGIGDSIDISNSLPLSANAIHNFFCNKKIIPYTNIYLPIGKTAYSIASAIFEELQSKSYPNNYTLIAHGYGIYAAIMFAYVSKKVSKIIAIDPFALNFKDAGICIDLLTQVKPISSNTDPKASSISELIYSVMQIDYFADTIKTIPLNLVFTNNIRINTKNFIIKSYKDFFTLTYSKINTKSKYPMYDNTELLLNFFTSNFLA